MVFKRYLKKVLTSEEMDYLQSIFEQLAYMSECLVFFSMGMSMFDPPKFKSYDAGFIAIVSFLCVVGRAAFVYPLSFILNYRNRINFVRSNRSECAENIQFSHDHLECDNSTLLDLNTQHMVVFAGLRGPISYGSSFIFPNTLNHRDLIITSTTSIVLNNIY